MKKSTFTIIFTLLFVGLAVISCGKYEEGPGFSLLSKKARLQQNWKPIEVVDGQTGSSTTHDNDGSYLNFNEDGSFLLYEASSTHQLFYPNGFPGTWSFSDDKSSIIANYESIGQQISDTIEIVQLKNNRLGLKFKVTSLGTIVNDDGSKTYYEVLEN